MDELQLLERFWDEVPEPDPTTVARARGVLLSALEGEGSAEPRRLRFPARRRLALLAALTAAGLTLALLVPLLLPVGRRPEAAAAALRGAAEVAGRRPAPPAVGPGQYVYTRSEDAWRSYSSAYSSDGTWTLDHFTREIWIGPDGSGRILETGDRHGDEVFGPGGLYFEDLSKLPTNIDELRAYIERRAAQADPPTDYEMFVVIGDLLRETYAPPELRQALFEVAAILPRTEYLGRVTDEAGRPGIGVGYTWVGVREELIFDPNTSVILGEREVQVDPAVDTASPSPGVGINANGVDDPGTVLGWAVYLESEIVGSTSERP